MKPHGWAVETDRKELIIESFERTKSKAIDACLRHKFGYGADFADAREKNWEKLRERGFKAVKAYIPRVVKFSNVMRVIEEDESL